MAGCNRTVMEWNKKSYVEFKTFWSGASERTRERERGLADDVEFIIWTTVFGGDYDEWGVR